MVKKLKLKVGDKNLVDKGKESNSFRKEKELKLLVGGNGALR